MPYIKFIWCTIKFLFSKKHPLCFVYCWKFLLFQPFPFQCSFDAVGIRTFLKGWEFKDGLKWKNQTCSFAATHWYLDCCLYKTTTACTFRWNQASPGKMITKLFLLFLCNYNCVHSPLTTYSITSCHKLSHFVVKLENYYNCICYGEFKPAQREWWQSMIIMIAHNIWWSNRSVHNKYRGLSCFVSQGPYELQLYQLYMYIYD